MDTGILESLVIHLQDLVRQRKSEEALKLFPDLQRRVASYEMEKNAALIKYILKKTPTNKHKLDTPGIDRARAPEVDFLEWQRGIEDYYKPKITILQHESGELRKILFKTRMDLFMRSHPELAEVPFAYCDVNRQLLCTPAIYDLFAIDQGRDLDLRDLLSHVDREDAKHIFKSLKEGIGLKKYRLIDDRSITINTYPLFYSELPVGVAMILESPELKVEPGKRFRFFRGILQEVRGMSEEYNVIKKGSQEKK